MITILAILGWLLFLFIAVLYAVGNRLNSKETTSLGIYSVALILSDGFRTPIREGVTAAIQEGHAHGVPAEKIAWGLVQAATEGAKRHADGKLVDSLTIVLDCIRKNA